MQNLQGTGANGEPHPRLPDGPAGMFLLFHAWSRKGGVTNWTVCVDAEPRRWNGSSPRPDWMGDREAPLVGPGRLVTTPFQQRGQDESLGSSSSRTSGPRGEVSPLLWGEGGEVQG